MSFAQWCGCGGRRLAFPWLLSVQSHSVAHKYVPPDGVPLRPRRRVKHNRLEACELRSRGAAAPVRRVAGSASWCQWRLEGR